MNKKYFRLTMIFGLFSLFFLFSSGELQAQEEGERKMKISGAVGYFSTGYSLLDLGAMNSFNTANGFELYDDNSITFGGGGFAVIRNFIIGGEGQRFLKKESQSFTQTGTLEGGWGTFNLGYVVYGKKGLLIYPRVGIGGYNHSLTLIDKTADAEVQEVIDRDYTGTLLQRKGMILSGSLGMDFMPGFDESSGSGLVVGLEVGYQYRGTQGKWTSFGTELNGGPDIDLSGLFVRLKIAGGGWHRQ